MASKEVVLALPKHKGKYLVCNDKHPLTVPLAGREVTLVGWRDYDKLKGSLLAVSKLDVFFGLDYSWGSAELLSTSYKNPFIQTLSDSFYGQKADVDNVFRLAIPDRGIDLDVYEFIRQQFEAGKNIGFGCAAGHGRTGWLYAKLIKEFEGCTGDEAVTRARERFCPRCVESLVQTIDLGCEHVQHSDALRKPYASGGGWGWYGKGKKKSDTKAYNSKDYPVFDWDKSDQDWANDRIGRDGGVGDWPPSAKKSEVPAFQEVLDDWKQVIPEPTRIWCMTCQRDLLQSEADEGWCPYCKSVNLHFDFRGVEEKEPVVVEEEEKISVLAELYRKWMNYEELTKEEEDMLDDDFVRQASKKSS